ncbi:site-2 protease family protein [Pararhodospirillum photometricum]|uniref:site-2 protease family protein n=1 Tax=Pararhodospirillum photometricum TaxID=1084 RepID=UPI0002E156F3|nr:site-2 protease family protein [Pararhodospirillum photometricum]
MAAPLDLMALPLPPLRDDLSLLPGPRAADGSPTWTLHDPVRHRYHRLGWLAFEMLARWGAGNGRAVCEQVTAETTLTPGPADLEALLHFLRANLLVAMGTPADRTMWLRQCEANRPPWAQWLLHNYLFIRIPLVKPDRFLRRAWPFVRFIYTKRALAVIGLLGVLGLFLVTRQWDVFIHTFTQFASLDGLVWMGAALTLTKVMHELGHAFVAHRLGCRVPSMGIAFLVLWPVLYTDTSDGWRLSDRRQRLAIGAAGVVTELAIALLATLAWAVIEDGPARSAAFFLASAGWIATLAINLSPFMRFDGYYILSDLLDEPNLQSRAFALGRWALREMLFGLGDPAPEPLPGPRRRLLIVYAWATWVYRLVLFLGIALLVYHFFIKIVGIFLFFVEIGWFILKPVATEIMTWWRRRLDFRVNPQTLATLALLGLGLAALIVPWRSTVPLAAVLEASHAHALHAPEPARVAKLLVRTGDRVSRGTPLLVLSAPDLEVQSRLVDLRLQVNQMSVERSMTDDTLRGDVPLLLADQRALLAEQAGLYARKETLTLLAEIDGEVTDLLPEIREGLWVAPQSVLLRVIGTGPGQIVAYARQEDLNRLPADAPARFHPDDALAPAIAARVKAVETVNRPVLDHALLASLQGGPLAAREDPQHRLIPERSIYRVLAMPLDTPPPRQVQRGTLRVEGQPESLVARLWRGAVSVLIRESAF